MRSRLLVILLKAKRAAAKENFQKNSFKKSYGDLPQTAILHSSL